MAATSEKDESVRNADVNINKAYKKRFFLPLNLFTRTQKFGLGISFSVSMSAFPSSKSNAGV